MNHWIRQTASHQIPAVRLFCFPHAGGGASLFNGWNRLEASGIEVCPVQLPGRENRLLEGPFTDMTVLIKTLGDAFQPYLDIPFALFGHSMGALIAYELARELRARYTKTPLRVFVSAYRAPQLPNRNRHLHALPRAEFIEELRGLEGTPNELYGHPELVELLLPALRADFAMIETYVHGGAAPLDCPLSAFGAWQDTRVSVDELASWRDMTHAEFDLQLFAGGHFYVRNSPAALLEVISATLVSRDLQ